MAKKHEIEPPRACWECGSIYHLTAQHDGAAKQLEDLIGQAPEGSHPDEQVPRAETWHAERVNWKAEVERLRTALSDRDMDVIHLGRELFDAKKERDDLRKQLTRSEAELALSEADRERERTAATPLGQLNLAKMRAEYADMQKERDDAKRLMEALREGTYCHECKTAAMVDEDGCCASCGAAIPHTHGYVHVKSELEKELKDAKRLVGELVEVLHEMTAAIEDPSHFFGCSPNNAEQSFERWEAAIARAEGR
jgi:cytochrome c556